MNHLSVRYRRRRSPQQQREFCVAQARRIARRWAKRAAAAADEPTRETRVVEITIRDSHRPLRLLRLQSEQTMVGWGRWVVTENGRPVGGRAWGTRQVAAAIALSL